MWTPELKAQVKAIMKQAYIENGMDEETAEEVAEDITNQAEQRESPS
jgi:hypothetical protein